MLFTVAALLSGQLLGFLAFGGFGRVRRLCLSVLLDSLVLACQETCHLLQSLDVLLSQARCCQIGLGFSVFALSLLAWLATEIFPVL